jgi:hypothetical protein
MMETLLSRSVPLVKKKLTPIESIFKKNLFVGIIKSLTVQMASLFPLLKSIPCSLGITTHRNPDTINALVGMVGVS